MNGKFKRNENIKRSLKGKNKDKEHRKESIIKGGRNVSELKRILCRAMRKNKAACVNIISHLYKSKDLDSGKLI